jgi:PPOX class probable F420-dependent enzyme
MAELPDAGTKFGARVRHRLANEQSIWLTTIGRDGTPQPNPVWFLLDGDELLIYNIASANRLVHIRQRPRVSLNFDSTDGDDVVVITGDAREAPDELPPDQNPAYVQKYGDAMVRVSGSREKFAATYHVGLRVSISKVRGF